MFESLKSKTLAYVAIPAAALLPALSHAQTAPAVADPTATVTSGITAMLGQVAIYGAALVGLALAVVAFFVAIKFIKRIVSAT